MKSLKQTSLIVLFFVLFPQLLMANTELQKAQKLIDQGNLDKALTLTEGVLKEDSSNIEARFLKGLLLARAERLGDAEIVFTQLTKDHPELPEPYNNLAVIYAAQGKFENARDALMQAINTHPSYATAHENLGDIYAKMASRAYNQALELDDGNASAREKLLLVKDLFSSPAISAPAQQVATVAKPEPAPEPVVVAEPVSKPEPAPEPIAVPGPVTEAAPSVENLTEISLDPAIEKTIYDWAAAWSSQDVDSYLSHYANTFVPPNGLSRSRWNAQRRVRLAKPTFIRVEISSPRVSMVDANHADASFIQGYASENYNDQVKKKLQFIKENGRWKILNEQSQ